MPSTFNQRKLSLLRSNAGTKWELTCQLQCDSTIPTRNVLVQQRDRGKQGYDHLESATGIHSAGHEVQSARRHQEKPPGTRNRGDHFLLTGGPTQVGRRKYLCVFKNAILHNRKGKPLKNLAIFCSGLICTMYLMNAGLGIIEIVPDNFPLIGNLDEASATALLLSCLAYFGLDLTNLFSKDTKKSPDEKERNR